MKKIFISVLLIIVFSTTIAHSRPTAKITLKIVDEVGIAVEEADVVIGFVIPAHNGVGTTEIHKKGLTDSNGEFSASSGSMNILGYTIDKEGYYQSGASYEFTSHSAILNRWEPWNPTVEVVLKKKRNPVPMYVKGGIIQVPVFDTPIGYDLEKGDWVTPYGKGSLNDFIFTCNLNRVDFNNSESSCKLTFSNDLDGIQEFYFPENDQSYYKWAFEAPIDGYNNSVNKWMSIHFPVEGYKSNIDEKINYIFRVRTETDENGKISKANYGKIKGDIFVSRKGKLKFYYFFNPDGTRNLEEDPDKNLFDMK